MISGEFNFIEIGYTISNLGGEGAIAFNIEVTGDTSGGLLAPYIPSVFQAPYVGGTLGDQFDQSVVSLTNNFQIIIPEGSAISPFTEELNFNLLYSPFAANNSTTIQSAVDNIGSDQVVTVSITAYQVGAENSPALIDENLNFLFEATPEFTSVEIKAYHNDRQIKSTRPLMRNQPLLERRGGNSCLHYMQDDFSIKAENQIAISVKNVGNSPMPLPNVKLSNTRMRTSGSLPGAMASGQSGFYITNSDYNQEYVDNDEIWMGYGAIWKVDHPFVQGIPAGPALAAALSSNSSESNQIYSQGYHDAYPYTWVAMQQVQYHRH